MTRFIFYINMLTSLFILSACFGGSGKNSPGVQQLKTAELNERALNSEENGNRYLAMQLLNEALRLSASLDDQQGQAVALLNIARLARPSGNMNLASSSVDRALLLSAGTNIYSDAVQEKAIQELSAGNMERAYSLAEDALAKEQGNLKGRRLNLMARIAFKMGQMDRCLSLLDLALSANSTEMLSEERANTVRLLGRVNARQNRFAKAEEYLAEAVAIDKKLEIPAKIAEDLEAFSEFYGLKGDMQRKDEYILRATDVRNNMTPQTIK